MEAIKTNLQAFWLSYHVLLLLTEKKKWNQDTYLCSSNATSICSLARWLKKNMQPVEDLQWVTQRLSVFGQLSPLDFAEGRV